MTLNKCRTARLIIASARRSLICPRNCCLRVSRQSRGGSSQRSDVGGAFEEPLSASPAHSGAGLSKMNGSGRMVPASGRVREGRGSLRNHPLHQPLLLHGRREDEGGLAEDVPSGICLTCGPLDGGREPSVLRPFETSLTARRRAKRGSPSI